MLCEHCKKPKMSSNARGFLAIAKIIGLISVIIGGNMLLNGLGWFVAGLTFLSTGMTPYYFCECHYETKP